MALEPAPEPQVDAWAREYLAEAKADRYRVWQEPAPSDEGADETARTGAGHARAKRQVELVGEMARQHAFDPEGGPEAIEAFLRKQTYQPDRSSARYLVHVSGGEGPPATLYVDSLQELDLVELLGSHGYRNLAVGLRDPDDRLEPFEIDELEQQILDDLYFDFDEEGVSVSFERFERGTLAHIARVLPEGALEGEAGLSPERKAEIERWRERADAAIREDERREGENESESERPEAAPDAER